MRALLLILSLLLPSLAEAATVTVAVRGPNGEPVRDAVVMVHLVGRPTPAPRPAAGGYEINQKGLQFHPFISVVPVGSDVSFPNLDTVRHHVYSFSPAKRFELKLYAREQNRAVRFDRAGYVALGCNIHDQMSAFVAVVDTVWAVKTDGAGNATVANVPAGNAEVSVWHPYLRAPNNTLSQPVALAGERAAASFAVKLRNPSRQTASQGY